MTIIQDDKLISASLRRREIIEAAVEVADRMFVVVIRDELQRDSVVNVARRAGMSRGNIYRLLRAYPEET